MSSKKWIGAAIVGAAAGAVAGLLFAPRSGKETREIIKKKAQETGKKAKGAIVAGEEKIKNVASAAKKELKKK